jgi:hypothetical protein
LETAKQRASRFAFLTRYFSHDDMMEDEIGRASNMHGEKDKCTQVFDAETA